MMAIDEIARAMAMDAMNNSGGGGNYADTYTRSEIDTKLTGKADADMVEEMQSDIASNKAALADVVNAGKKNLLDTSKLPSVIVRDGITITSNVDGSLTIVGKNGTGSAILPIANFNAGILNTNGQHVGNNLDGLETYRVSTGLEKDIGIGIQVCYSATGSNTTILKAVRTEDHFEYSEEYPYVWFRLLIASDAEFQEPVIIKPMVCKKSLYDISPDFKQYVMSNAELTESLKTLTDGKAGLKIVRGMVSVLRNYDTEENRINTEHVTFPENAFKQTPTIVVTPRTGYPQRFLASVDNVNANGFDVYLYNGGASATGTTNINYIAIGV